MNIWRTDQAVLLSLYDLSNPPNGPVPATAIFRYLSDKKNPRHPMEVQGIDEDDAAIALFDLLNSGEVELARGGWGITGQGGVHAQALRW
jgi:hypothetical protein